MTKKVPGPTAALAGVPAGVQGQGVWGGRRQLFIRFAAEAETATLYTSGALADELRRLVARSVHHSVSIAGRDPLANVEFLCAVFDVWEPSLPVMLDTDGQRPDALGELKKRLSLVQVVVDFSGGDATLERALHSLAVSAKLSVEHALVLIPGEGISDGQLLRIVEQAHVASAKTLIVVHPPTAPGAAAPDRRWATFLEQASMVHPDIRVALRLASPLGMR